MSAPRPFRFKQFDIHQDRCAMKVGTDGVLLGAWAELPPEAEKVLDVGTGTGLIALQLAQRYTGVSIWGIEKDPDAAAQCRENFRRSPWGDRLRCHQGDFGRYPEVRAAFDAVVSNPPYHSLAHSSNSDRRGLARASDYLPLELIFRRSLELLRPEGRLYLVWPFESLEELEGRASESGCHLHRQTGVRGRAGSPFKRVLTEWGRETPQEVRRDELTIERHRGGYTEEFIALTRDFYLRM